MIIKKDRKIIWIERNDYVILIKSSYNEKCNHCNLLHHNKCLFNIKCANGKALFYNCYELRFYIPKFISLNKKILAL